MRQDRRRHPLDPTRKYADAGRLDTVLVTRLVEHLHADTDAQDRLVLRHPRLHQLFRVHAMDALHTRREGTDAWHDKTVATARLVDVGRHGHVGAGPAQRPLR